MKKILKTITVLIILCMLVLTLSGCGKKKEEKNIEIENKLNVIELLTKNIHKKIF